MINLQPLLMKTTQCHHTVLHIVSTVTVTGVCVFQIGRNLDAGCRVKIVDMLTNAQWRDYTINIMFLGAVDKLLSTLTGDADNVPLVLNIEGV